MESQLLETKLGTPLRLESLAEERTSVLFNRREAGEDRCRRQLICVMDLELEGDPAIASDCSVKEDGLK